MAANSMAIGAALGVTFGVSFRMKPKPPEPKREPIFGYHNILKTEWKKGRLPTVKKGFYGDVLTMKNVSLEHLQPKSKGGANALSNFVLASKQQNNARGDEPLKDFINPAALFEYFSQFVGVKTKRFDGDSYIAQVTKTLESLGIDFKI